MLNGINELWLIKRYIMTKHFSKFIFLVLLTILLFSCKKERGITYPVYLFSKWDWINTSGGFAGFTYTPESTGDKIIIEFTPDFIYKEFLNDTLIVKCKFHIIKSATNNGQDKDNTIIYDYTSQEQSYLIKNEDTLVLNDGCCDGFESQYIRIK